MYRGVSSTIARKGIVLLRGNEFRMCVSSSSSSLCLAFYPASVLQLVSNFRINVWSPSGSHFCHFCKLTSCLHDLLYSSLDSAPCVLIFRQFLGDSPLESPEKARSGSLKFTAQSSGDSPFFASADAFAKKFPVTRRCSDRNELAFHSRLIINSMKHHLTLRRPDWRTPRISRRFKGEKE